MILKTLTSCLTVGLLMSVANAAEFQVPWLSGPIIDEVGWIEAQDRAEIEKWIRGAHDKKLAQLQIYIPRTLGGLSIEEVSIAAASKWKLGNKERDDGVLFVIAPNERKLRIEVGQGLEGQLTDLYSKRIIDYVVLPHVRDGHPSRGVREGVAAILTVVAKDVLGDQARPLPEPSRRRSSRGGLENWIFLLAVIFILIVRLLSFFGGGRRFRRGWGSGIGLGGGGFGSGGGGWSGGGGGFSGGGSSGSW